MALPRGNEYDQAVQMPQISFNDNELKSSQVETNPLGLPKPYSGGFTTTFRMYNSSGDWAVRCFTREIQDLQKRYQSISSFLSKNSSQYFVSAKYLANGIRVSGKEYPIIKMQWLKGEPLNIFLAKNYKQKDVVEKLLSDFVNLVRQLETFGIAHGDLQHGNIIVKNNQLFLIDYDGMFFPELAGLATNEVGHINYQHPQRSSKHYNKDIDRFAAIIIYLGLKAISLNPNLWKKYDDGENILFRQIDFADLQNSELIHEISAIPELKELIRRLIGVCYLDFEKIPTLQTFIDGNFSFPTVALHKIEIGRSQYLIIDGTSQGKILEHVGERVEVIGKIFTARKGTTKHGDPYYFLNMGGYYPNHTFTVVLWKETINAMSALGINPNDFDDEWMSVTGVISSYKGRAQVYIEQATQIQKLSGQAEAQQRLRIRPQGASRQKPSVPTQPKFANKEIEVLTQLYGNKQATPVTKQQTTAQKTTTSTYKPTTTYSTTPSKKNNSGCMVQVVGFILGAGIGALTGGLGFVIGGIAGVFLIGFLNW